MVNPHEEQLLTNLLAEVAREDAALEAAHLEARVCDACMAATGRTPTVSLNGQPGHRASGRRVAIVAGAAAAAILLALASQSIRQAPQGNEATSPIAELPIAQMPIARSPIAESPIAESQTTQSPKTQLPITQSPITPSTIAPSPIAQSPIVTIPQSPIAQDFPIAQSPIPQSPMEFIPLTPFSDDLSGSFQIMRVQLPRASLGPPRSPFEQPHELVEADVLLGEDGTARAIHVSSSQQFQPWRPR